MVMFRCQRPPLQHILNEGPRYVVPREDGRVLVGSTEEEVGFQKQTTPEALQELAELGRQLVGPLNTAVIEKSWAGLRPGSFDGLPYLGQVPNLDNVYVAAGHFRNGLFLSPATAVVMGRMIRGENTKIDLSPFHPGRG
jgi:glycine oxidase